MEIKVVRVQGPSMFPLLQNDDHVYVESYKNQPLVPGDLYYINADGNFLIHRYLGQNVFKGDSNRRYDNQVFKQIHVEGHVVAFIKKNKNISLHNFLLNKTMTFLSEQSTKKGIWGRLCFEILKILSTATRKFICMI